MFWRPFLVLISALVLHGPATALPRGEVSAQSASAAAPSAIGDVELSAFADGFLEHTFRRSGIPGGAVVLVRDGRVILSKGYGLADVGARRPVTIEDTLFRQASISKLFVWLLALQLQEEGRLNLDEDVNNHLDFEVSGLGGAPVTMRRLMTHTPGFAERMWGVYEPGSTTPLADRMRRNVPTPAYTPGDTIAYSNYGAGLATLVIEHAAGAPFEQLVEDRIFSRVGMTRSSFAQPLPAHLAPLLASGYLPGRRDPAPFQTISPAGSGGLTASPEDMGRFLTMLLQGGQGVGGQVVRPETLAEDTRLHVPLGPGLQSGFGLGFLVEEYREVRHVGHAGNLADFVADLKFLPDHGIGWYLAFNGEGQDRAANALREDFARALIDRLLGEAPTPKTAQGPSTASEVAGSYLVSRRVHDGPIRISEPFSLLSVREVGDGLLEIDQARRPDASPRRWLPQGPDRFVDEDTGLPLVVTRDQSGQVARLASPLLMPVAVFERAPGYLPLVSPLLGASTMILFLAAAAGPVGWAGRRAMRAPAPTPSLGRMGLLRRAARASVWLVALTLLVLAVHFIRVSGDGDVLFKEPHVMLAVAVLAALCIPGAITIAADAALSWRDPSRGWGSSVASVLVAAASLIVAWVFVSFDLITFSRDY